MGTDRGAPGSLPDVADLTSSGPPDDTQVTELAVDQQTIGGEEDGFVWSDTF